MRVVLAMTNIRKGKGFSWRETQTTGIGHRETSGFTVDNLDTKSLSDASNNYEKIFIIVRDELFARQVTKEKSLQIAQDVSDRAREKGALN